MTEGTAAGGCLLVALSHPDDEIGCIGTIALHRALGVRVVLLYLSPGEATEALGPLSTEEVAAQRISHAQYVAGRLGCELRILDFQDTRIEYSAAAVHQVARTIAEFRPDAVLTWGEAWVRGLRHPDHQATGQIVRGAITVARIKRAVAPLEPHRAVAPVFTLRDRHSTLPCVAFDVTAYVDTVLEIGRYYHAQMRWPEEEWLQHRLESVGRRWGVAAAEEFDAWESVPGLRQTLLGAYLPI